MNPNSSGRYSRQSFLGNNSQQQIEAAVIGVVGLGGGGSHIIQQLAHIGFKNYVLYDADCVEATNLNRLIGATVDDAKSSALKLDVAKRSIFGLQPDALITGYASRWQESSNDLKICTAIIGAVDGFDQRRQLEAFARRYLLPYIDIGMDVHQVGQEPPFMAGQVILSMPGHACMHCLGFLNEKSLANEAAAYGSAGPRPQVVWPNGLLASTAVGILLDLITDWTGALRAPAYLSYRGNQLTLQPHPRLTFAPRVCVHYPIERAGAPEFARL